MDTTTTTTKRKGLLPTTSASSKRQTASSAPRLTATSPPLDTQRLRNDRLGTLVNELTAAFANSPSWETFVHEFRGRSYLAPELDEVDHPAAELLRTWRDDGVPAETCSPPWTFEQKDHCIQRGCHKSATEHASFLRDEMAEFIESKFWAVLPYRVIRDQEQLMFSPAAVKDERDRKPRLLCDHSWPWAGWPSINETTLPHSPPEAMQFGHANPKFGPVRASKYDIKDGFYRLFLKARDCLRLSLVLPKYEGEEQLVAIPLACTMGWVQSPPTFCTMSETVCDLANKAIRSNQRLTSPHRLEATAADGDDLSKSLQPRPRDQDDHAADSVLNSLPGVQPEEAEPEHIAPPSNCAYNKPLGSTDVFVDDFIQLGQGGKNRMIALRGHLLQAVDQVLAQHRRDSPTRGHLPEEAPQRRWKLGDPQGHTRLDTGYRPANH